MRENLLPQRLMRAGGQSAVIKHGSPPAAVQKAGVDQDSVVTESALAQVKMTHSSETLKEFASTRRNRRRKTSPAELRSHPSGAMLCLSAK